MVEWLSKVKELASVENVDIANKLAQLEQELKNFSDRWKQSQALKSYESIENELEKLDLSQESSVVVKEYLSDIFTTVTWWNTSWQSQKAWENPNYDPWDADDDWGSHIDDSDLSWDKDQEDAEDAWFFWSIKNFFTSIPRTIKEKLSWWVEALWSLKSSIFTWSGILATLWFWKFWESLKNRWWDLIDSISKHIRSFNDSISNIFSRKSSDSSSSNWSSKKSNNSTDNKNNSWERSSDILKPGDKLSNSVALSFISSYYSLYSRKKWTKEDWSSTDLWRTSLEWVYTHTVLWAVKLAKFLRKNYGITDKLVITWWTEKWHKTHSGHELDIRSTDRAWKTLLKKFNLKENVITEKYIEWQKVHFLYHWDEDWKHKHIHVQFFPIDDNNA